MNFHFFSYQRLWVQQWRLQVLVSSDRCAQSHLCVSGHDNGRGMQPSWSKALTFQQLPLTTLEKTNQPIDDLQFLT